MTDHVNNSAETMGMGEGAGTATDRVITPEAMGRAMTALVGGAPDERDLKVALAGILQMQHALLSVVMQGGPLANVARRGLGLAAFHDPDEKRPGG